MTAGAVILVDETDKPVGAAEKLEAHKQGLLHRAFSVFIFNSGGEMLLQQRAMHKYHSGGLWSNTCCSHPIPDEATESAAQRRLLEEMGIETPIEKVFDFIYKADFENGMTEHEFDHVFAGQYDGVFIANENEVMNFCYKAMSQVEKELSLQPETYTVWFRIAFPSVKEWWTKKYGEKNL